LRIQKSCSKEEQDAWRSAEIRRYEIRSGGRRTEAYGKRSVTIVDAPGGDDQKNKRNQRESEAGSVLKEEEPVAERRGKVEGPIVIREWRRFTPQNQLTGKLDDGERDGEQDPGDEIAGRALDGQEEKGQRGDECSDEEEVAKKQEHTLNFYVRDLSTTRIPGTPHDLPFLNLTAGQPVRRTGGKKKEEAEEKEEVGVLLGKQSFEEGEDTADQVDASLVILAIDDNTSDRAFEGQRACRSLGEGQALKRQVRTDRGRTIPSATSR